MPILSEADSKRLAARYGVRVVRECRAATPDAAAAAASQLGFPIAVKLHGPGIAHKSDRGLVRLGVRNESEVRKAAMTLLAAARPEDGPVDLLVARMVPGFRELIVGMHVDAQFGPCVIVGVGGVLAEAIDDVSARLVPIIPADADEMIDDLRPQPLLGEVRGEAAVDRNAVAGLLLALSRLAEAEPDVIAVDLNPVIIGIDGMPIAVDALVEVRGRCAL
jgi:succinyl-CoA synthetase beta subunit